MIVGYVDNDVRIFCARCWSMRDLTGACPDLALDSADEQLCQRGVWIVERCQDCQAEVRFRRCHLVA